MGTRSGVSLIANHCRTVSEYPCFHCSASKVCKLSTESLDTLLAKERGCEASRSALAFSMEPQLYLTPAWPLVCPYLLCSKMNGQPGGKWAKGKEWKAEPMVRGPLQALLDFGLWAKDPWASTNQESVRANDSLHTRPRGSGTHHKMLRHVSNACQLSPSGT